jgi:hypothetical protein
VSSSTSTLVSRMLRYLTLAMAIATLLISYLLEQVWH